MPEPLCFYILSYMKETFIKNSKNFYFKRNLYFNHLLPFIRKPIIKVLTGMRRVGKSVILKQVAEYLLQQGVRQTSIFFIDKESLEFENIANHHDLHTEVKKRFKGHKGYKYLIVDEVQEIRDWEKAIVSLAKLPKMDIFLSGSNAHMLSSELATLLSGRYMEFPVYPLGFDEFLAFRQKKTENRREELGYFLRYGGLPGIHYFPLNDETVYQYLRSLYDTILLKDVVMRHKLRQVMLLENMVRYICDNIGNFFSAKRISDYLKSHHLGTGVETVLQYLSHLEATRLVFRARRFDIRGKRHLELIHKFYLGDVGIRHSILGFREGELSGVLENVVYLELLRHGYLVSVGKLDANEVDFIAEKEGKKIYIQVAYSLSSSKTAEREFKPLLAIDDNYPKYVISTDEYYGSDHKGIVRLPLETFLLDPLSIQ